MLNPKPEQILPRLFWPILALALLSGLAGQLLPAVAPGAFTRPWPRNPWMLAAVHLSSLGWLGTLFLAVTAQAVAVLLHRSQERTFQGALGPGLFHLGALGLVAFLAGERTRACLEPALLALGLGFGLCVWRTAVLAKGGPARTRAWAGLVAAHAYLAALLLLGGLMAVGLLRPLLPQTPQASLELHIHLALAGFAGLAILGLLPKLLRLFLGATRYPSWPGAAAYWLVHLGLVLQTLAWLGLEWPHGCSLAAALAFALAALGLCLQVALQARAATKPLLSSSFALQSLGLLWLLLAAILDVGRAWHGLSWGPAAALVYLALFGWVGGVLLGTGQRIMAVLAWMQRFHEDPPAHAVPTAWWLIHPGLAWSVVALHTLAVSCGTLGLALGSPGLIRAAGLAGAGAVAATLALLPLALGRGRKAAL